MRSRPVVLGAISLDLFAVLLGGATALLPIYARDILHVGPIGLGMLRSAPAIGAASIGIALGRRPLERHTGKKIFVVHRLEIDYRRPARLGDALTVSLEPVERSRVRLVAAQKILRDGELISNARVTLACLDRRTWRPVAIPECVPGGDRRTMRGESAAPTENPR